MCLVDAMPLAHKEVPANADVAGPGWGSSEHTTDTVTVCSVVAKGPAGDSVVRLCFAVPLCAPGVESRCLLVCFVSSECPPGVS